MAIPRREFRLKVAQISCQKSVAGDTLINPLFLPYICRLLFMRCKNRRLAQNFELVYIIELGQYLMMKAKRINIFLRI